MTSAGAERHASSIDGLPKQFVTSLRILFDILDEDRTGYVRLCDIESRWHEEGVRGLPSGVIESLRKVAPRNGRLTFENFVTGLKLSLLKTSQSERSEPHTGSGTGKENKGPPVKELSVPNKAKSQQRATDKPVVSQQSTKPQDIHKTNHAHNDKNPKSNARPPPSRLQPQMGTQVVGPASSNTATVRPNNVLQSQNVELRNQIYSRDQIQQATVKFQNQVKGDQSSNSAVKRALPVDPRQQVQNQNALKRQSDISYQVRKDSNVQSKPRPKSAVIENPGAKESLSQTGRSLEFPPGRPERPPPYRRPQDPDSPPAVPPYNPHGLIVHELKNWHRANSTTGQGSQGGMPSRHSDSKLNEKNRYSYAGNEIYVNINDIQKSKEAPTQSQEPAGPGKPTVRRQNSRRHTLSSGVDYNMIRRMKQLEREKDLLLQGLEVVDRTREWYMKKIATVTEKQHTAEKTSCSDSTLQSDQERVDLMSRRILDATTNLKALMDFSTSSIPAHMNLEVRNNTQTDDQVVRRLKDQNKQLTQEVGSKSEKITQLEKEKASLIRDLFAVRSKNMSAFDDKTFL